MPSCTKQNMIDVFRQSMTEHERASKEYTGPHPSYMSFSQGMAVGYMCAAHHLERTTLTPDEDPKGPLPATYAEELAAALRANSELSAWFSSGLREWSAKCESLQRRLSAADECMADMKTQIENLRSAPALTPYYQAQQNKAEAWDKLMSLLSMPAPIVVLNHSRSGEFCEAHMTWGSISWGDGHKIGAGGPTFAAAVNVLRESQT